jgi:hypothetical protein
VSFLSLYIQALDAGHFTQHSGAFVLCCLERQRQSREGYDISALTSQGGNLTDTGAVSYLYKRHRFPPEVIAYSFYLYYRLACFLRDIWLGQLAIALNVVDKYSVKLIVAPHIDHRVIRARCLRLKFQFSTFREFTEQCRTNFADS